METPITQVPSITPTQTLMEQHKWKSLLGATAFAGGICYAFAHRTGFWKGWGIAIVFGIAGSGIGFGLDSFSKPKK